MKLEKGRGDRTKTVGTLVLELDKQAPYKIDLREFGEEILQKGDGYMKKIWACIQNGLEVFGIPVIYVETHTWKQPPFFTVTNTKNKPRVTCPLPTYGQSVWKFDSSQSKLELLWNMPDRETCISMLHNPDKVEPQAQKGWETTRNFYNGTLDTLAHEENGKVTNLLTKLDGGIVGDIKFTILA